ncbi:MAG: ribbon-helix-helix protein, CopG family [Crenarchaeota archaeon]|nr:ribbon-helix-helix protein, CopG family [Thermoproteota archaeon]
MSIPTAIYVRVQSDLLIEFDKAAQERGMSRSEAIREAMRLFIKYVRVSEAGKLRGLVEDSKLPSEKLEQLVIPG